MTRTEKSGSILLSRGATKKSKATYQLKVERSSKKEENPTAQATLASLRKVKR